MIRPIGNRVVIKPNPVEEVTAGGIIIPESGKEKPQRGVVVAAAKGLEVKDGDEVMYGKHSGSPLEFEGKEYLVMTELDVIAIL